AAFVSAARLVVQARPDAQFVWIGDGPLRSVIEQSVRRMHVPPGNVHVVGERDDARGLYPAFDVFLFTTRWEGMPYAVLEAMAASVPVVSLHVPGMDELVEHGHTGMLVNDDSLLGSCVVDLLKNGAQCAGFGLAARHAIEQRYSVAQFIGRLEDLYAGESAAEAEPHAQPRENA
ncbi:MAG TPA: glycosyltransferase, partial [Planctomycetota bacterium]|nr:glycosyltransferase [Planctomycetota bacterium]